VIEAIAGPTMKTPNATQISEHTRRVVGLRLLPFLFILYIVNYVDRTNLAYAAMGMSRDLGFSDHVFGLGAGIFFISYLALQIPGALLVERWSARRMISATMIAWGSLTVLAALVHTPLQLYLARFVLGAAEAGFFPGVIVYLSHWFIFEDRAKATSNFMGAIPLSAVLGSPLAGWILGRSWLGFPGWRWLFVVEGAPAILLGIVAFFFLTDWPREAEWLNAEQRKWLEQKLKEETPPCTAAITVWQAMRSPTIVWMAALTFLAYIGQYTLVFWFPTMLKRLTGFTDMRVGMVGALPFLAGFVIMQVNGWHSDKQAERRWHAAMPLFVAGIAYFFLSVPGHSVVFTIGWFTVAGVLIAYISTFWAIPTEILSQAEAATAVGLINSVGSIAGFAGPYIFGYIYTRTGGSFSLGLRLVMAAVVIAGLMILRIPKVAPRISASQIVRPAPVSS
jgi:ACS family tartrate transporter-like MFS transporter